MGGHTPRFTKLTPGIKRLVLADSIGAFISCLLLVTIILLFQEQLGMPGKALYVLLGVGCMVAIFSTSCNFMVKKKGPFFLKIIAVANTLYCLLIAGLMVAYFNSLTFIGVTYFSIEILVIGLLVFVELSVVNMAKS